MTTLVPASPQLVIDLAVRNRNRNRKRELDIARITKKNMRALQKFAKRI